LLSTNRLLNPIAEKISDRRSLVCRVGRHKGPGFSRKGHTQEREKTEGKVLQDRFFVSGSNLNLSEEDAERPEMHTHAEHGYDDIPQIAYRS
jgi:hypothetical protein